MNDDMVRQFIVGNDFFEGNSVQQGKNVYVPRHNTYPHIHVGDGFITYSKSKNNHMYLYDAGGISRGRIVNARQDCGETHIMQVCRYMESQG